MLNFCDLYEREDPALLSDADLVNEATYICECADEATRAAAPAGLCA